MADCDPCRSFGNQFCCDAQRHSYGDVIGCDPRAEGAHEATSVHHAARRRGLGLAARGARAAAGADAADHLTPHLHPSADRCDQSELSRRRRASRVSSCSMTARGWRSAPRRSQLGKCHRKFQLHRSKPRSAQPADVAEIEQVCPDQGAYAATNIGERRRPLAREQ